jgi:hypothetical protein
LKHPETRHLVADASARGSAAYWSPLKKRTQGAAQKTPRLRLLPKS